MLIHEGKRKAIWERLNILRSMMVNLGGIVQNEMKCVH